MTLIGPVGNSIGSLHQEVLKRAEQNLVKYIIKVVFRSFY